jgi:hypothetical protein
MVMMITPATDRITISFCSRVDDSFRIRSPKISAITGIREVITPAWDAGISEMPFASSRKDTVG